MLEEISISFVFERICVTFSEITFSPGYLNLSADKCEVAFQNAWVGHFWKHRPDFLQVLNSPGAVFIESNECLNGELGAFSISCAIFFCLGLVAILDLVSCFSSK